MSGPAYHARTHLPDGTDPLPGLPDLAGTDIYDRILALPGLAAFWPLDESSGTEAHDASGNGHDLTSATGTGHTPPTWGQAAGPPGTTSAKWDSSTDRVSTPAGSPMAAFTDDFTSGVWINMGSAPLFPGEIIGQGTSIHTDPGWALIAFNSPQKFGIYVDSTALYANNTYATDTWYFVAVVRDSGTWKLYIDGLLQASTITDDPGSGYGSNTWIGNDAYIGHTFTLDDAYLSYAFIVDAPLTSTELLGIYESGTTGGALDADLVWTTDGAGGASWQPNLTTIAKDGSTGLTGDVTLSEGANITLTQAGQDIEIASSGGGFDPATATSWWMPLVDSDGTCVLDGDGDLIPTLIPL